MDQVRKNDDYRPGLFGKLGRRLFCFFGLSSLIPLTIMIVQGYHCAHRAVNNAAQAHLLSFVENKNSQIVEWIEERAEDIQFLSQIPCLQSCCCNSQQAPQRHCENVCNIISTFRQRFPDYEKVYLWDLEGNEITRSVAHRCASDSAADDAAVLTARSPLWQSALQTTRPVFAPVYHAQGMPNMQLACVISDESGKPYRVLWAQLDMASAIRRFLSEKAWLGKSGKLVFIGPEGEIISDDIGPELQEHIRQVREDILASLGEKRYQGMCLSRHNMIGAFSLVAPLGMVVLAEISWDEAMAELFHFLKFSLITAGWALVLVFVIAGIIARRLSAPILKIALATRGIAHGDLSQRVSYAPKDEIGMLVEDFNSMGRQLETSQQRLIHSQALAATGKMVASIVHEIRNPLSSVKMNLQILTRRLQEEPRFTEHGKIALQELGNMEDMLSELLDFSRPVRLQRQRIDIGELIQEGIQTVAAEISQKEIAVRCDIHPLFPPYFLGDMQRMKQVVSNLVLNAVQSSESREEVVIRAFSEKQKTIIEIIDHGRGIMPDDVEHIFDPFFTTRENGTGLGLSHAQKIVEHHEGTISVQSEPGKGSKFTISLPQTAICDNGKRL